MAAMELWERYDALKDALSSVDDAIMAIRPSELDDDISDMLDDVQIVIRHRVDDVRDDLSAHERAEREALEREYWKAVI